MKCPESPCRTVTIDVHCCEGKFFIREMDRDGKDYDKDSDKELSEWRKSVMSEERLAGYRDSYEKCKYDKSYPFDDWLSDEISFSDLFDFYGEDSLHRWSLMLRSLSEDYIVDQGQIKDDKVIIKRKCSPEEAVDYKKKCHEFRIWEAEMEVEKAKASLKKILQMGDSPSDPSD